jgi:hypothetical protein
MNNSYNCRNYSASSELRESCTQSLKDLGEVIVLLPWHVFVWTEEPHVQADDGWYPHWDLDLLTPEFNSKALPITWPYTTLLW